MKYIRNEKIYILSNKGTKIAEFYLKPRIQYKHIRSVEFMIALMINDRSV